MSFKRLVEGDCGGNNSLVQLSSIVTRDATLGHGQTLNAGDQFVNEFLHQNNVSPQTFNMGSLLNNVTDIQTQAIQRSEQGTLWQKEYPQMNGTSPLGIVHQSPQSSQWNYPLQSGPLRYLPPALPMFQNNFRPVQQPNIQIEYINQDELAASRNQPIDEAQAKAQELVDSVDTEDQVAYTQFMSFMNKVSSGEVSLNTPPEKEVTSKLNRDEQLEEMANKYKSEWEKLSNVSTEHPWLSHFSEQVNPFQEYTFSEENSMLENKNALEIGKEKLKMGDVPGAVLCFEAVIKQEPESVEGWFLLGTTQAENEQDPQAIAALNKCLEMDPTNLNAHMTLAAAYTNENYPGLAYKSLHKWLKSNPKYETIIPQDLDLDKFDTKELQEHIQSLFFKAAQMNPTNLDPDVQCALGVLFNITQEYEKAVDCFKTALNVKNDDSKIWNKLGATLANGERSEEAVNAYHRALALEPGFIRARYNVGITCMNLGAYKEAAEHFLVALNQQKKAQGVYPQTSSSKNDNTSSTIWSTLRMVCAFMGEHDVTPFIDARNLEKLNQHFGV